MIQIGRRPRPGFARISARAAASFNGRRLAPQIFVGPSREKPLARKRDSPK
jgi:hypothetical protein